MYFFLDNAMKRLKYYPINQDFLNNVKRNIIKKEYQNQHIFFYVPWTAAKKQIAESIVKKANKVDTSSTEFCRELKLSNKYFSYFKEATQKPFGLLRSFLPWTAEHKLREKTGKHLNKAKSKFSELISMAHKSIR